MLIPFFTMKKKVILQFIFNIFFYAPIRKPLIQIASPFSFDQGETHAGLEQEVDFLSQVVRHSLISFTASSL